MQKAIMALEHSDLTYHSLRHSLKANIAPWKCAAAADRFLGMPMHGYMGQLCCQSCFYDWTLKLHSIEASAMTIK
jgi:hypothetical protein